MARFGDGLADRPLPGWLSTMRNSSILCRLIALGVTVLPMSPAFALASLQWSWRYTGAGISARGTLTTDDVADGSGYFQITGITGSRNGVRITRLQPAGTAIPGNAPYSVDNLVSSSGPHLTDRGFGFALADGTFVNPFFAHTHRPSNYLEFFSDPRMAPGTAGARHSESRVTFTARIVEPVKARASRNTHTHTHTRTRTHAIGTRRGARGYVNRRLVQQPSARQPARFPPALLVAAARA